MEDLVISQDTCFVLIRKEQWESIEKADKEGWSYQFTGRVAGLRHKGELVYVRCVAGVPNHGAWRATDFEVSDGDVSGSWL